MISKDSLAGNRTTIRHQLCSLIGLGHVTVGNPSSSRVVIARVWLRMGVAIFSRFTISLSQNRKLAIVWTALYIVIDTLPNTTCYRMMRV